MQTREPGTASTLLEGYSAWLAKKGETRKIRGDPLNTALRSAREALDLEIEAGLPEGHEIAWRTAISRMDAAQTPRGKPAQWGTTEGIVESELKHFIETKKTNLAWVAGAIGAANKTPKLLDKWFRGKDVPPEAKALRKKIRAAKSEYTLEFCQQLVGDLELIRTQLAQHHQTGLTALKNYYTSKK